jgi:deoxyribonuclease V
VKTVQRFSPVHPFDVSYREAKRIQEELSGWVDLSDRIASSDEIELVGGADVAFLPCSADSSENSGAIPIRERTADGPGDIGHPNACKAHFGDPFPEFGGDGRGFGTIALAVAAVIDVKRRDVVETAYAAVPVRFPYIPGFLTFREGPAVLAAIGELTTLPGVMLYDGAGIAHPRGFGIASHMAVLTGIPSIGCAKSLLAGVCDEPGIEKGEWTYLHLNDRPVGVCLRTRRGVKPIYVSPGSGFSVDGARRFILSLDGAYRLPEPTRLAHLLVTEKKRRIIRTL